MSPRLDCSIMIPMKTIIKKIDDVQSDRDIIEEAGQILKKGGLVAFPTETVYGLGADALNEQAAEKIYAAKGRPSDNPLIVHIAGMEDLPRIAEIIPEEAKIVAEKFWPGPLTMIFDKTGIVPYETTGGLNTVAVRMPSSDIARELIRAGGGFIAAPSANTSGRPSPTMAQHVEEDLDGKIDMILDGGTVEIGVESTILDMTVSPPMLLRPGAVTKEMLEELIGPIAVDAASISADSSKPPKAPGMKYRHYAPKADLSIVEGPVELVIEAINGMAAERIAQGYKVGIIGTEESRDRYRQGIVKSIGTREDEATIASHLYAILREFDHEEVDYIYSESFARGGIGNAIMNQRHYEPASESGRSSCDKHLRRKKDVKGTDYGSPPDPAQDHVYPQRGSRVEGIPGDRGRDRGVDVLRGHPGPEG